MLFIELAVGIAVLSIVVVLFVVALQVAFWIMVFFLILASIGFLLLKFPLEILITILIVQLIVLGIAYFFKGVIGLGRRTIRKFYSDPPPSDKGLLS